MPCGVCILRSGDDAEGAVGERLVVEQGGEGGERRSHFEMSAAKRSFFDGERAAEEGRGVVGLVFAFKQRGEFLEHGSEVGVRATEYRLVDRECAASPCDGLGAPAERGERAGEVVQPDGDPRMVRAEFDLVGLQCAPVEREGLDRAMHRFEQAGERVLRDGGAAMREAEFPLLDFERAAERCLRLGEPVLRAETAGERIQVGGQFGRRATFLEDAEHAAVKLRGFVEAPQIAQHPGEAPQVGHDVGMRSTQIFFRDMHGATAEGLRLGSAAGFAQPSAKRAAERRGTRLERMAVELAEEHAAMRDERLDQADGHSAPLGFRQRRFDQAARAAERGRVFFGRHPVADDFAHDPMHEDALPRGVRCDEAGAFELAHGDAHVRGVRSSGEDGERNRQRLRREADEHMEKGARRRIEPHDGFGDHAGAHGLPALRARGFLLRQRALRGGGLDEKLLRRWGVRDELQGQRLVAEGRGEALDHRPLGLCRRPCGKDSRRQIRERVLGRESADGEGAEAGPRERAPARDEDRAAREPRQHGLHGPPRDFIVHAIEDDEKTVRMFLRAQPRAHGGESRRMRAVFVGEQRERIGAGERGEAGLDLDAEAAGEEEHEIETSALVKLPRGLDGERGLAGAGRAGRALRRRMEHDDARLAERVFQLGEHALASGQRLAPRREGQSHQAPANDEARAQRVEELPEFRGIREGPVLATLHERPAMILLQSRGLGIVQRAGRGGCARLREKKEDRFLERLRDVHLEVRERPAHRTVRALRGFGTEG